MKAVLGKTIGGISGGISTLTRGTYNVFTSRFRRSGTVEQNDLGDEGSSYHDDRDVNTINGPPVAGATGGSDFASSPALHRRKHPSLHQEDDILYRKNNVFLKCKISSGIGETEATPTEPHSSGGSNQLSSSPAVKSLRRNIQGGGEAAPSPTVTSSVTGATEPTASSSSSSTTQQEEKVPGFLFIASRGANYGSTLILNWAPNSSIIKCSSSINSRLKTAGESSSNSLETTTTVRVKNEPANEETPSLSSDFSILGGPSPTSSTSSSLSPPSSSSHPLASTTAATIRSERSEVECISIDLGEMEVIRIFYRTDSDGCMVSGEMVVSSRQTDFWVFKFLNGGLTDLIHLFSSWDYFNHQEHREAQQHTFTIFRPRLSLSQLHPGEGEVKSVLTSEMWEGLFGPEGRISESQCVKKVVFFQGVSPSLRKEVWPFLLGVYNFDSTSREREEARLEHCRRYWALDDLRRKIQSSESRQGEDWGTAVQQIDKDVVRTDRSHPYYKGDSDNGRRHVGTLKHILLNYLLHKPDLGYCQGMTDLLAPLLASMENDIDAFWCFEKLVEGTAYFKPANNPVSVEKQLEPLRLLIKQLLPWFYSYLETTENGLSLMFCHRWLLVCFKREFTEEDTLAVWEACWTNYETTTFHLFVCVAVMAIYGQRAVEKHMNINELMVFFNTLSHTMPREVVLTQARGYLYQFSTGPTVHCLLSSLMHPEFWHRSTSPRLECGLCRGLNSSCESRESQPTPMESLC